MADNKNKKYKSIFDIYDKLKFSSSDSNLGNKADSILYKNKQKEIDI